MARGRKRKTNQTIPAHIAQNEIPKGVYWDSTGKGRWRFNGKTIAGPSAKLSELHRLAEMHAADCAGTINAICALFHASPKFRELAPRTQDDYTSYQKIARTLKLKNGQELGELIVDRMSAPLVQRLIDKIAETTPTKANHLLRYLRRVFAWAVNRGHCKTNPAKGIEQAKERGKSNMPANDQVYTQVLEFARLRGSYLPLVMELAYLCRLRGIEALDLNDASASTDGIRTNRRKGSRDNVVKWSPRLRQAWAEAVTARATILKRRKMPIEIDPAKRFLFCSTTGGKLTKSGFDTAWQRMIRAAIASGIITAEQRFSMHGLKHKGITDTTGNRAEKLDASGHKSASMMNTYDHSVPLVNPARSD